MPQLMSSAVTSAAVSLASSSSSRRYSSRPGRAALDAQRARRVERRDHDDLGAEELGDGAGAGVQALGALAPVRGEHHRLELELGGRLAHAPTSTVGPPFVPPSSITVPSSSGTGTFFVGVSRFTHCLSGHQATNGMSAEAKDR